MQKFFIFLIALFIVSGVMAQSAQPCSTCLPQGITFYNQAQIDNFQTNYPNCTEIEGGMTIIGSDITNLNGLNVLTSIGGYLWIDDNAALTSLTGLENITSIGGDLVIYANNALTSLTGLENLTSIGGVLDITYNSALTSLTGLESLTSIDSSLYVKENSSLTNLTGLEGVTTIRGGIEVSLNNALTSLTGLENITSIWGALYISDNAALTSLTGMEGLQYIGGALSIGWDWLWEHHGNPLLRNLTGLENLTSIGGSLSIGDNDALTSLTGLDNINAGSITNLIINGNPSLSTCEVQSICDYLAYPNGSIEIYDNATGCNSQEEVDSACVYLSNGEVNLEPAFSIYPNPASTQITISTPTTPEKNTFMTIYSANGKQLIERQLAEQQMVVDVSWLPQGVYFVKVADDRTVMVGKFVKN